MIEKNRPRNRLLLYKIEEFEGSVQLFPFFYPNLMTFLNLTLSTVHMRLVNNFVHKLMLMKKTNLITIDRKSFRTRKKT